MLEAMARKYTVRNLDLLNRYYTVPDICIGTDVIVGFQEKPKHDQTVLQLMTMPIHYFHVFSYSERKFARSRRKEDRIDAQTIAKRSKILRNLSQQKRSDFYQRYHLKPLQVLFESQKNGCWWGLTIIITNKLFINENLKISLGRWSFDLVFTNFISRLT